MAELICQLGKMHKKMRKTYLKLLKAEALGKKKKARKLEKKLMKMILFIKAIKEVG